MFTADFAMAAVLISFGAVLGKASVLQLVIMAMIEIVLYQVNTWIGYNFLQVKFPNSCIPHRMYCACVCVHVFARARACVSLCMNARLCVYVGGGVEVVNARACVHACARARLCVHALVYNYNNRLALHSSTAIDPAAAVKHFTLVTFYQQHKTIIPTSTST